MRGPKRTTLETLRLTATFGQVLCSRGSQLTVDRDDGMRGESSLGGEIRWHECRHSLFRVQRSGSPWRQEIFLENVVSPIVEMNGQSERRAKTQRGQGDH